MAWKTDAGDVATRMTLTALLNILAGPQVQYATGELLETFARYSERNAIRVEGGLRTYL